MKKHILLVLIVVAACGVLEVSGQQPATAVGPYTAAQATAGGAAYQTNCASCHQADLSGQNNAPALAGTPFMGSWGTRTVSDLVGFLEGAMPPGNPGGLGEAAYLNIAAFILQSNGARAGTQALMATNNTTIRTVATGVLVAQAAGGRGGRGGGGRGGAAAAPAPRGLMIAGTVKNYTPITDAMMKHSRSRRLADAPTRLSCQRLQHAEPDQRVQREGSATAMGVGHG